MIPISASPAPISYLSPNLSSPWAPQKQHIQDGIPFPLTNLLYLLNAQFHLTAPTLPVAQNCNFRIILTTPLTLNILSFQNYQSLKTQHLYHMSISYHPYCHYFNLDYPFPGLCQWPLKWYPCFQSFWMLYYCYSYKLEAGEKSIVAGCGCRARTATDKCFFS